MSDNLNSPNNSFGAAASRVIQRVTIAKWMKLLSKTALLVYPIAAAVALLLWFFADVAVGWPAAAAIVLLHLAVTAIAAWLTKPSPVSALALWDQRAQRDEMFTSAYCFEQTGADSLGEKLHIAKARARLDRDLGNLRADLPAPLSPRAWLLPIAFLALIVGLVLIQPDRDRKESVDELARAEAEKVANELEEDRVELPDNESLEKDERDKLKKLEASMEEMRDKLRNLDKETPRDVLAELERRAHEAEELAKALSAADLESLSSEMIAELERHADTSEFGSALRAEKLEDVAEESDELAELLEDDQLSLEAEERLEEALRESMNKADEADKQSLVGQSLTQSLMRLQRNQPDLAAEEFRRLAKQYRKQLQRELTKKQLEKLSQQLRNAGQKIFGRQQSGIRQLAKNPAGMRRLGAKQLASLKNASFQLGKGRNAPVALGKPGQMPLNPKNMALMPVPGTGQQPPSMIIPGTGQGQGGQCPIPGTGQGAGQGAGQGHGQGAGMSPVPGQGGGNGGLMAGQGTAGYGNTATTPLAATRTGQVNAQISQDGPSMLRNIERGERREDVSVSTTNAQRRVELEEQSALADETLPLARRQQVLRYFTALRRQLVDQSGDQP